MAKKPVHVYLVSSGPHCTEWADDQQRPTSLTLFSANFEWFGLADLRPKGPRFGWDTFGWASSNIDKRSMHDRLECKRPSASTGPPSGRRTAASTPLSPLYSTGTRCPV